MTHTSHRNVFLPRPLQSASKLGLGLMVLLASCQSASTYEESAMTPAKELLARSIEYHDPESTWGQESTFMSWTSVRPNGDVGYVYEIEFKANGDFCMHGNRRGHDFEYMVIDDIMHASVDGNASLTDEMRRKMAISSNGGLFWRNYLGFLGSCPMNLPDADAYIMPRVMETTLDGRDVLSIDMTFDPEVGKDTYTFYFEPESARLVGLRFYRNDPTEDGETILFDGESEVGSMLLPQSRRWYTNADWRFLGTDEIH